MRIKLKDIDPQLRIPGVIARILMRPSQRFFRFVYKQNARTQGKDVAGLICETRHIPSLESDKELRVRIYRSHDQTQDHPLPGVLFLHGGGYAIGNPEMSGDTYQQLIANRSCVIVAPDYRKSLESPYPAAINDCYATLLWMKDNAAELGIRQDQLIVAGQSAGGGLTAAVSLMARDQGQVNIAFQLPLYPMLDDRMTTESARNNNAPVWSSQHNRVAWDLYLGGLERNQVPKYAAPAREHDLSNLPPTATFVGSLDPFRDETRRYVDGLRNAGVPVAFQIFDRCYHGFDILGAKTEVGKAANNFLNEQFAHAVDNCFATQPETQA